MSTKTTVKSYVKEVIARLEGNSDKAIAAKNQRLAIASVKGQVAALEGQLVQDEMNLETAQENLGNAKYPTVAIGDSQAFVQNVQRAQERVDDAQEAVETTAASIEFFNGVLADFEK